MRILMSVLLLFALIFNSGCVRVPGPDVNDADLNPWIHADDIAPNQNILNIHATSDRLFLLTETEFISMGSDRNIDKKRDFISNRTSSGIPAIHEDIFARLGGNGSEAIEFHLTRNTKNDFIFVSDFSSIPGENVTVEVISGRPIGAFNANGTKFILPTKTTINNVSKFTFFIFQILRSNQQTNFLGLPTILERIDINPNDLPIGRDLFRSIKYIRDEWYVATKSGAFKINEAGLYTKIDNDQFTDIFRRNGKTYITAFDRFDMLISEDNGDTWDGPPQASALQFVTIAGDVLVSQEAPNKKFETPEDASNIFELKEMRINESMASSDGVFNSLTFFNNEYYLVVGKELFYAPEILVVED